MEKKKITFDSFVRGILVALVVIGLLALVKRLSSVLLPFFIAWLVAYMVYPLVTFFQYRLKVKNRVASIFCALGSLAGVGIGAFYLLVPPMVEEFMRVKDLLGEYFLQRTAGGNIPSALTDFLHEHVNTEVLTHILQQDNILDAVKSALPGVWSLVAGSVDLLFSVFTFFIILLYVVFILLDYESIASGWLGLVPRKYRAFTSGIVNDIKQGMNRYFRGQSLIALCVGILFAIGFKIIGLPLGIALGLFIGVLNLVPYLQTIGIIPMALLSLLKSAETGENFWLIFGLSLLVLCIVQAIQDLYLTPKIMGKAMGLNPAIILLSLSVWGSLLGFIGLIIALPLTTLCLSYYKRFVLSEEEPPLDSAPDNGKVEKEVLEEKNEKNA